MLGCAPAKPDFRVVAPFRTWVRVRNQHGFARHRGKTSGKHPPKEPGRLRTLVSACALLVLHTAPKSIFQHAKERQASLLAAVINIDRTSQPQVGKRTKIETSAPYLALQSFVHVEIMTVKLRSRSVSLGLTRRATCFVYL